MHVDVDLGCAKLLGVVTRLGGLPLLRIREEDLDGVGATGLGLVERMLRVDVRSDDHAPST